MDEVNMRTPFTRKLIAKWLERRLRKALKRKISLAFDKISIQHKEGGKVELSMEAVASMDEAELYALLEQIADGKEVV